MAGGFHFSERRRRQKRGQNKRISKSDALENPENRLEEEMVPTRANPGNQSHDEFISIEHEPDRSDFSGSKPRRSGRFGKHNQSTASGNDSVDENAGVNVRTSPDTNGYGFDSRLDNKNDHQYKNRIRRRPGRRGNRAAKKIIFPPKPNRHHPGLEKKQSAHRNVSAHNKGNSKFDRRSNWAQAKEVGPLYAALDLGTNNCRLLVALPQQSGRFRVVDAFSRIVRLGKGMEQSGRLDDKAMDRAVEALVECARKLKNNNILKSRLIATEACRRAVNGESFLSRVLSETGLELEIVDRETEAYLAAEGCGALVDKKADGAVLFDIGGGSSELILLDRRGRRHKKIAEQIASWTSLSVGVVTLSERHGGKDVSHAMFDAMVEDVENHLSRFEGRERLNALWSKGRVHLLGTSGTVTTLAGVHLKLPRYDRRQVDGIWLTDQQVDKTIEQLLNMDYHQRAANPCIGSERADLVLAGCAILQAIRKTWPSPRLRVADRGLREGILTQMMNQDGAWVIPKKGRKYSGKRSKHKFS